MRDGIWNNTWYGTMSSAMIGISIRGVCLLLAAALVVSCRTSGLKSHSGRSMVDSRINKDGELAARITIAALRSLAGAGIDVRRDRLLIDQRPFTFEEATRELMAKSKPRICRARLEGNLLAVD